MITTFEELGIAPEILRAIKEMGFESPMPVQAEVIPLLLNQATDIIALAQTGTGKTAAFGLPVIQQINVEDRQPQALILCPTRELCLQIAGDLNDFALHIDGFKVLPVYGGSSIETQITALKRGVHVVVATPGRLIDLIHRRAVKLGAVSKVVLDEADEMLNMGFLDSINEILSEVPEDRNTLLFSATMPNEVAKITKNYMKNPLEVTIGNKNSGSDNVKHLCYMVHARDKYLTVKRIADYNPNIYGIVFCRTRRETQEIADKLIQDGYSADSLHGDLSQAQRDHVMQKFRVKNIRLLVATDVAARGLDVDSLTHVINYNLPEDIEAYTHRSGRTGRAGRNGVSIAITHVKEKHIIRQIEKKIGKEFQYMKVPTGREICEKQLFSLIDKMEKVELDNSQIDTYLPVIYRKLEFVEKEELIKRFVSLEFNRFLDYYRNAPDIHTPEERPAKSWNDRNERSDRPRNDRFGDRPERAPRESDSEKRTRKAEEGFTRLFLNVGKLDGINPKALIDIVNESTPGQKVRIGRIDLMKSFSFMDIDSQHANELVKALKGADFQGNPINAEIAKEGDGGSEASDRPERSERRSSTGGGYQGKRDYKSDSPRSGGYKGKEGGSSSYRGGNKEGGSSSYRGSRDGGSSSSYRGGASKDAPSKRREPRKDGGRKSY